MSKNAVERCLERFRDQWLEAMEDNALRLIVWRIPQNAGSLLSAFLEAQKHPGDWQVPDHLFSVQAAFETGYGYSRALREELLGSYKDAAGSLQNEGIGTDWEGPHLSWPDSPVGTLAVFDSFARHHAQHLRSVGLVLQPERVIATEALIQWLETALSAPVPASLRLVLIDTFESPDWQSLIERHKNHARLIEARVDMFDVARDVASQAAGAGPQVAFRQLLSELMTLLERGSASRLEKRATHALALAGRQQWFDQQAAVHMMVAGGWMKDKQFPRAVQAYERARVCSQQCMDASNPGGADLLTQTWFGEAGAWLAANDPLRAAQAYLKAAKTAALIPRPIFEIEGLRMGAWCFAQAGKKEKAREVGVQAVRVGRALPETDRAATTLSLVLNDILTLQDATRVRKIRAIAQDYEAEAQRLHARAEIQANRLGAQPQAVQITRIEHELHDGLERAFHHAAQARELLIQRGDGFFRKLVVVARGCLHPQWNGLPDIHHPLNREVPAWREPPASQPLPEPGDLTEPISAEGAIA